MKDRSKQNQKQTEPIKNGIRRLEELGKRGKMNKVVTITVEHFEFLKNSMNDYSLRILAYIIKGFFLSISKNYQTFIKEIEAFIDLHARGIFKQKRQAKKRSTQQGKETEKFTCPNLSLSETTMIEKFLENPEMNEQIEKTLQEINNTVSMIDFDKLTPEEKKEFLQKHFLIRMFNQDPTTSDFFVMSQSEMPQAENELQLADYINFNIDAFTENIIKGLYTSKKTTQITQDNFDCNNNEVPLLMLSQGVHLLELNKNRSRGIQGLMSDNEIEISLEDYLKSIETKLNENDSEEAYVKNLKQIIIMKSLENFIKLTKEKESLNTKYYNENYYTQELLRNHSQSASNSKSQSIQFENRSLSPPEFKSPNGNSTKLIDMVFDYPSTSKSPGYDLKEIMKERGNIQAELSLILSSMNNYEEISMVNIIKTLASKIPTMNRKSTNEKIGSSFYHLLIVCQSENKTIHQSDHFGSIFYIK